MVVKKRKTAVRAPRKKSKKKSSSMLGKVLSWFATLLFLVFSLSVLGYVVFFRTVQAEEPDSVISETLEDVVFEEPNPPSPVKAQGIIETMYHGDSKVSIIIDDMGYHEKVGRALLALPYSITFSFLPHAPFTAELVEIAYQTDKTILLHLPMQPKGSEWDPGHGALLLSQDHEQQKELLEQNLAMVSYATGINNHMGSLYTEHDKPMLTLLEEIKKRELFFVDSFTTANSVGYDLAKSLGINTTRRHVFLDNVSSVEKICTQLEKLVITAEQRGEAVGIGHPKQETFDALEKCMPFYEKRVEFVGVSELVR